MTTLASLDKQVSDLIKRVDKLEVNTPVKSKVKRAPSEYSKFVSGEYERLKNTQEYSSYQGKDRFMAISKCCAAKWREMNQTSA
jgi:hypothetical protein